MQIVITIIFWRFPVARVLFGYRAPVHVIFVAVNPEEIRAPNSREERLWMFSAVPGSGDISLAPVIYIVGRT